jgi:hypothetical protein
MYRAIVFYKLRRQYSEADQIFKSLLAELPTDVELRTQYVRFLKEVLKTTH